MLCKGKLKQHKPLPAAVQIGFEAPNTIMTQIMTQARESKLDINFSSS